MDRHRTDRAGRPGRTATLLSVAAAAAAVVGAGWTVADPGLLRGPAVMNGSARGTAAVLLAVTVPLLLIALSRARAGSRRAVPVWWGALAAMLYNAVLLLLATPFNDAFLV